ncbi:MAG: class II fructose-bisphosphate aldolase [Actinobacteria bacterium]|nr:class II fructose-bisphosphate aldolase [Actinomycetota bacterium]
MIAPLSEVLGEPGSGRAVGAFTAYDLEAASGILRAAESRRAPVILLISRASFVRSRGPELLAALRTCAERAEVAVCLQLDHVADGELIARAGELGCGAVMADGSKLSFERNVELVAAARDRLASSGAEVEAELGHLEGGEDVAALTEAGSLTDPDQVPGFVAATGASCLAVSIGNVHGAYAAPPRLDWERLTRIRERTDIHLSLHGASGLDADHVRRAVELGVTKVNVNLELRQASMLATEQVLPRALEGFDLLELHDCQVAAVEAVAAAKMDVFGGGA